ncbi:MAG TPA: hypothetical protein DD415_00530 [Clostridiales bacterium]|nr:hypothetical protein [Clostridiales bacterium]
MSKKFSKKLKWVIPFAVLSLTCASVGVMAGCKDPEEEHTHVYEWQHNETEHWKECPADGEEEAGTRGEHLFVAGECECGATETVAVKKYGKVTGTVKLHKLGGYETDFTDVTVDMGDEVHPVFDKTTGTFTIDEVEVNKYYSLTVSKPGYQPYTVTVQVPTENETVTIGGQKGIVLEYQAFSVIVYDEELHDFSNINNENPTIKVNGRGGQSLDIISSDTYEDVSLKIETKASNGGVVQGVILKFEDGKCAILNIKTDQSLIQYRPELWGMKSVFGDRWVESKAGSVTAEDKNKFNGDGVELNLVRKGGKLIAFVDGRFILETSLPDGYEDDKVQVGFYSFDVKQNAEWAIGVSETLPALESALDIDVTQPDNAGCTVTATPEKQKYAFGEEVELTVTAASGYMLSALTVNGEDKFSALNEGKLTLLADRENIEVAATFVEKEDMALNLTVKGKKLGQTTALAEGTKVSLSGISEKFTVNAEGKITADTIAKARYTISVEGYFAKDIILDENLTEVVLEYDTFYAGYHKPGSAGGGDNDNWDGYYGNPDKIDKSHVNDADPYFTVDSTDFYQYTNDKYSDVVASITAKAGMTNDEKNECPTIGLVFEGNKAVILRIQMLESGGYKVQWIGSRNWLETSINGNWDFGTGEEFYNPISNTLKEKYVSTGLKLSLMRKGDTVYAFVDDVFVAKQTITGYADKQCSVMFAIAGVKGTQNIPFDISSGVAAPTASVTDKTTDTNGTVTLSTTTAEVGTDVTIKVEPNDGYIIGTVEVNGVDVTDRLSGGEYTFTLSGDTEVEATFEEITTGSINAEVSGKKLGVTGNSLSGDTQVVLTSATAGTRQAALSTVEGKTVLKVDEIVAGKWTVQIEGYIAAEIEVAKNGEYTTAITLEYDTFSVIVHDRELHDFSNVNNPNSTIKVNGSGKQSFNVISQDKYDAVCVTINTQSKSAGVIQGILLKFEDGNYAIMNIKTDQSLVQYRPGMWGMNSVFGSDKWVESAAGTVTQSDIDKFNGDGVVLKLVRTGGKMYTFVDGRFVHVAALPEGYEDDKVQVGFFAFDVKANAEWAIDISETLPALTATVTNETAQDAHGTVTGIPAEAVTLGDEVTVTIAPEEGYIIGTLKVNDVDVTSKISGKDYTFAVKGNTTVVATFEEIVVGSINAEVSGKRLGASDLNGLKVTLKNSLNEYIGTVSGGKLEISDVISGTYTVSTEYTIAETEIAVEANTEYTEAIDLTQRVFIHNLYGDKVADSEIDYTHVFDENGYVAVGENGGYIYEFIPEAYGNVVFSTVFKKSSTTQNIQAIGFIFGDYWNNEKLGAAVRIEENVGNGTAKFQWQGDWGGCAPGINFGATTGWQDFNDGFNPISSELKAKYAGEGITVTIVRNGTTLDTYLDGVLAHRAENVKKLTADMKVYPFIATQDATPNSKFYFSIDKLETAEAKIAVTPTTGISVTTDKTSYSAGEEATITVSREEGYVLDKIQIGARCYDKLEFDENAVATIKVKIAGNVEIKTTASQVTMTKTSLESNVIGKKYGSTENLVIADGTAFKVFNNNFSYLGTVTDGKISIPSIVNGTYTVHVEDENYVDNTVTVGDTAYTSDITLAYLIFTSAPASADLSEIYSGKVTATGKGGIELTTKESYTDCTVEAVFDVPDYNSRRYSVALIFDDGKDFRVDLAVQDNGSNMLQETNWNSMMLNWAWVNFPENYFAEGTNSYTEAEIRSEFIAKGLTYKLERTGSTVKLYINGVLMKTYELTGDYANKSAQIRFIQDSNGTDGTKGFTFAINVPEATN